MLVVDAAQGIEAQTLANAYLAIENNLEIIPVVNKIDLPSADPDGAAAEVCELLGGNPDDVVRISAKTGLNVDQVLDAIIERIPAPEGDPDAPARALVFDSSYDQYRGVIAFVRVVDGRLATGASLHAMAMGTTFDAEELGYMAPQWMPVAALEAGEVGYVVTGLKDVSRLRVGDTLTTRKDGAAEPVPGYKDVKPMVFAGLFPSDSDDYPELRDALEKLKLNDAALFYEPETSTALGFGFRCGFLGLLHMEIVRERLEREFDLDLLVTAPNVAYNVKQRNGDWLEVHNPSDMPREIDEVQEPYVNSQVIVPKDYVGAVMELCTERRGRFDHMEYLSPERVLLVYELPARRDRPRLLRPAQVAHARVRQLRLRPRRLPRRQPRPRRRPRRRRAGRRALAHHPPRLRLRPGQAARRAPPRGDPATDVRRRDPGRDRLARDRPRDGEGAPQGRAREVLRRRHLAQAQAAREAEEGQEADEAGRRGRGSAGGIPRRPQPRRRQEEVARPWVAFGTSTSTFRSASTAAATATSSPRSGARPSTCRMPRRSFAELEHGRHLLADPVETVFIGGGTPTFMAPDALRVVLAALPPAVEVTVEANPETITPELVALLCENGVNRISLGAQSFQPHLLEILERQATPEQVRHSVTVIREAGVDNLSLDLIYGIPGQTPDDLARDLEEALSLEPEHLSAYELEAKPGTRFTHAHGAELERQAEALEGYLDTVVDTMLAAGYRWYETANFCRVDERDLRARHNLGYWRAHDYLGVGVGAVSTVAGRADAESAVGRWLPACAVER